MRIFNIIDISVKNDFLIFCIDKRGVPLIKPEKNIINGLIDKFILLQH